MQHYWSLEDVQLKNTWLTIGSFDGVHLGHQEIVRRLTTGAQQFGSPAVVLTFFPHPAIVLGKRNDHRYLTTPEERAALLVELGVDVVITHPFDLQLAATSAMAFMEKLVAQLRISHLLVGHDFALGKNREGDVVKLRQLGEQLGYTLDVVPPFKIGEQLVSSSRVRKVLNAGDVTQAAVLLGRPYRVSGEVISGDGRGRSIGIPTANLAVWPERVIPKPGVYVCRSQLDDKTWGAVTNIGVRPTFENQPVLPRVEVHLLDFDADIYGQKIQLDFLSRLRDEQRFPGVQALVEQIRRDIAAARLALP